MPDDASIRPSTAEAAVAAPAGWLARRSRTERVLLLGAAILGALILWGAANWWLVGRYRESTDNAYVRADISVISAKVSGYVRSLAVTDNQSVAAGDVLLMLEPSDYEASLAQARANLARAQSELASIGAQRALAAADLERYRPLARRGILSPAGMQQIEARAAQFGASEAASAAAVDAARAQVETAEINLERTMVRAPVAGLIGDRQVQLGQLVQPGAPLMAIVPMQTLFVVANYKETQLGEILPGQSATITPDIERGVKLHGVVDSIAPASGAEFSIIPMDTATGNFTKIVQRVPVRIRLEGNAPEALAMLRPGLSVGVTIDTHVPPAQTRPAVTAHLGAQR